MIVERCTALAAQFSAARRTYQLEERLGRIQEATDRVKGAPPASGEGVGDPDDPFFESHRSRC